jgi:FkbM family methyltransferase
MFDASDTLYYLEEGYKVVAVEANSALATRAQRLLAQYVDSGQLSLLNAAISENNDPVTLTICGDDLGSSSVLETQVSSRTPIGNVTVPGITTAEIFSRYGTPYYLKVDLEGMDGICVKALSAANKPEYLSFEVDDSIEEYVNHLVSIGFKRFKLINQIYFRELANQENLRDRVSLKIIRLLGYAEPQYVKRAGRLFKSAHSSGPAPWCSDGSWHSDAELMRQWKKAKATNRIHGWYDLHAV